MPELPEVETVARGLRAKILNKRIASLEYRRANLRFVLPPALLKTMPGKKIVAIDRHSKYVLLRLESGESVLLHLGMSGRLLFGDKNYKAAKHDHVIVNFAGGMKLVFNDARRFGVFDIVPKDALHRLQKNIGPDALSSEWTPETLHATIAARKTDMKAILMNQKIIAGLGNIYVSEALYRAKISPTRSGKKVTLKEAAKLLAAIRAVLREAIAAGGSSLRDYVQTDGELGYFQTRFRVYGRAGTPCRICKTPIRRMTQAGRSTFYCPKCQK